MSGELREKRLSPDRQELWWLESFLMVNGTTEAHRERRLRLYRYLCSTCEHNWGDVSGWGGSPRGTYQCSWCNLPCFPDDPDRMALVGLPTEGNRTPNPDPRPLHDRARGGFR